MSQEISANQPHLIAKPKQQKQDNAKIPLAKSDSNPHFKVKNHYYYTGDGSSQSITEIESSEVDIAGVKVSAALGKDVVMDREPTKDPTVLDLYLKKPITEHLSLKGRLRNSFHSDKSSSQARLGLEASIPVSDNGSFYAQVYGADKLTQGGHSSGLKAGAFVGYSHKLTDRVSFYVEGQSYDLGNFNKENLGINAGLTWSF